MEMKADFIFISLIQVAHIIAIFIWNESLNNSLSFQLEKI